MATTNKPFASFVRRQFDGNAFDWDAATLKATLHNDTIVPDRAAHDFFADLAASELATADGYIQGGKVIDVLSVAFDAATRQVRLLASNPTVWDPITVDVGATNPAFRYIVVRRDTGNPATSELVCVIEFDVNQTVDGALTVNWDATGVGRLVLPV